MYKKSEDDSYEWGSGLFIDCETQKYPRIAVSDSLSKVVNYINDNKWYPWIVPEAVEWLENNLTSEMVGVEFGAGLSTGWFCKKLKFLHTFECNKNWAMGILDKISDDHNLNSKWYLHFINCDWNKDGDSNRWYIKNNHHIRSDEELSLMEQRFMGYNIEENIDFCFVDGSVRYETFLKSIEMIQDREGAIMCVDNSEKPHRKKYLDNEVPKSWKKIEFINTTLGNNVEMGSKTTIFIVA